MEPPSFDDIERSLEEIAATSQNYYLAETPDRLLELSSMTAGFVKVAVESKMVTPDEMRTVIGLFNLAAEKWHRQFK